MSDWRFRPARDLALPIGERLGSIRREPTLAGRAVNAAWRAAVRAYLALFHRLEITGQEHLPSDPPCVLVCNHTSHLDALCLGAALPPRLARHALALAAGDVFFRNLAAAAFAATALNALPVRRDRASRGDLALLRERLAEDGLVYLLFPEGTRARDGVMGRFRPGLGALVAGTAIPVIPCYLDGAHASWPASRRLPRPGKLRLRLGPPLRFDHLAHDGEGWRAVTATAEAAVRNLRAPSS